MSQFATTRFAEVVLHLDRNSLPPGLEEYHRGPSKFTFVAAAASVLGVGALLYQAPWGQRGDADAAAAREPSAGVSLPPVEAGPAQGLLIPEPSLTETTLIEGLSKVVAAAEGAGTSEERADVVRSYTQVTDSIAQLDPYPLDIEQALRDAAPRIVPVLAAHVAESGSLAALAALERTSRLLGATAEETHRELRSHYQAFSEWTFAQVREALEQGNWRTGRDLMNDVAPYLALAGDMAPDANGRAVTYYEVGASLSYRVEERRIRHLRESFSRDAE